MAGDIIIYLVLGFLLLAASFFVIVFLIQVIKRGSIKRPHFSRATMLQMLQKDFPVENQPFVLECLDRYRQCMPAVIGRTAVIVRTPGKSDQTIQQLDPATANCEPLLAQIQMSILRIARGKLDVIKKYTDHPETHDYRDIIIKAGLA